MEFISSTFSVFIIAVIHSLMDMIVMMVLGENVAINAYYYALKTIDSN